ncbi:AAA family ATPase [Brucella pseudintermedia]|uniref:AAA family ATPase n=1 Tax=Brucella pseudintermedia TaxID=370111 RepID=UPI00366EE6F8|nr:AAA family ATPase [Brucella pseudintermedia]
MRIKKIQLKNGYKRFKDLTIDLGDNPARIVVLVGPNGCGKSSVFDGMLFLHNSYTRLGNGQIKEPGYHLQNISDAYDANRNIEIQYDVGAYGAVRQKRIHEGTYASMFSFRSPYRYNNSVRINEIRSTEPIEKNSYGASDASSIDAKMEENYRRLHAMVNRYMEDHQVAPGIARAKVIGDLNSSITNCLGLEIANVGNVEASQGTLYFKKPDQQKEFEFNVLSSGEKEVVDILVDLYLRKETYDETVFLIDEPELHVNTAIQAKLLREINNFIGDRCQLWITTHSLGFLRVIQNELSQFSQVIQFKEEFNLASEPRILKPIALTPASWRDLFEVALDDVAALIAPDKIVFCEGRADTNASKVERGMDARAFNAIFGNNGVNAFFVSSGGNNELEQRADIAISIIGKALPTMEILVLKDRDMASGKVTKEADRQEYLSNNPTHHRLLRRWEIENYLFDKEVLRAYCDANGKTFDEASYDQHISDIVNDDVKSKVNLVKNCCEIKGSVNPDAFKINLAGYVRPEMEVYKELYGCVFGTN